MTAEDSLKNINDFVANSPIYPNAFHGQGIVICGGGIKYFPGAWITIRILRQLNCNLPIELWCLNGDEVQHEFVQKLKEFNVTCVNAEQLNPREKKIRGGWQLKPYAIMNSSFQEVIYIDADNIPVRDPSYLFSDPNYLETGSIFWPGFSKFPINHSAWSLVGVPAVDTQEFESGQLVINKERCWPALALTLFLNENADFYYQHFYGDKDTFLFSLLKVKMKFSFVPHPIKTLKYTMCQHDFSGERLFQHRVGWYRLNNNGKWSVFGRNYREPDFWLQNDCFKYLAELKRYNQLFISATNARIVRKNYLAYASYLYTRVTKKL